MKNVAILEVSTVYLKKSGFSFALGFQISSNLDCGSLIACSGRQSNIFGTFTSKI